MSINPANIQRPVSPVSKTYVPAGGRKHPVQTADTWISLAAPLGISAWELIRYNYPGLSSDLQVAAKEVNWYLEQYVGCTRTTTDNRNYVFSPPGSIWLPPKSAPTADQLARQRVLRVLRGPLMGRMTFGVGALTIQAAAYEQIAKAIESGRIEVKENRALGHMAYYYYDAKPALIEVSPTTNPGLIVHECTHAIFDMRKLTTRVQQSEGFGYLSQALYEWLERGGPPTSRYMVSADWMNPFSWLGWQTIFDESNRLADKLAKTHWIPVTEVAKLYAGVGATRTYRDRVGKVVTYDGI